MALAKRSPLVVVLALGLILMATFILSNSANAGNERVCSDETISSGTFSRVIVEAGTSCTLTGSVIVEGDVDADGAVNVLIIGIRIDGNVRVENSLGTLILIRNSEILGHVDLDNNTIDPGNITVIGTTIAGNLKTENNLVQDRILIGACPTLGNSVGGNVTIRKNAVDDIQLACNNISGNVTIREITASTDIRAPGNTVNGNVTIRDNSATRRFVLGSFRSISGRILPSNTILGNVVIRGNANPSASIVVGSDSSLDDGNNIGGSLTIEDNTAQDEILLKSNSVSKKLKCKNNNPDPVVVNNIVDGELDCTD